METHESNVMIKMIGFQYTSKPYQQWAKGLETHGDVYEHITNYQHNKKYLADCYLQQNLIKNKHIADKRRLALIGNKYQYILDSKKPFLVAESSPFREYKHYRRWGWNSYGWKDTNCNNANVGPERWNAFVKNTNISIHDWHSPGDNIIIMGQKEGDSSLNSLYNSGYLSFYEWVEKIIKDIRKYTDRKIIIRPHPRNLSKGIKLATRIQEKTKDVIVSKNLTKGGSQGGVGLEKDLSLAYCVITFNSLSAIEALTRGIPVFASNNMSMAWPIAHKDFSQIENLNYDINLQDWKNKIAYTMWNKDEVSSGKTWEHLKSVYFK